MVHRQNNQGLEVARGGWLWSLKTRPAELGPFYMKNQVKNRSRLRLNKERKDTLVCM